MSPRSACLALAILAVAIPSRSSGQSPPTGFIHDQFNPGWVALPAEQPYAVGNVSGGRGYKLTQGAYTGNAFGQAIVPELNAANAFVEYRIRFNEPGTYLLHQRLSLLALNGGNPEVATSYDNHNSVWLPRAFGENPNLDAGGTLVTRRKNLFSNSQWPFPHGGNFAWSTTESIIYHNYSVFPAHELTVTPAQVNQPLSLFIRARESGWAIDSLVMVNTAVLPRVGDNHYHSEFDGTFLDQYYIGMVSTPSGDPLIPPAMVPAYDWTGDGIADAVRVHPRHFTVQWRGIDVWALDLTSSQFPTGDSHPDTGIMVNGRLFETHFAGFDPDGGVTPGFLDSLFIPEPTAGLAFAGMLAWAMRCRPTR